MRNALMITMVGVMVAVGTASVMAAGSGSKESTEEAKLLRHVVLFGFKESATADEVKSIEDAFRALPSRIDAIQGFEWGTDVSPEKLANGFTHCFFLTFKSAEDRDTYLKHPDHKAFGALLGPYLGKVLVVDYWAEK